MKPLFHYLTVSSTLFLILIILQNDSVRRSKQEFLPLPLETIVVNEGEKKEYFEWKQQWTDAMHLAAPGMNWRKTDMDTRNTLAKSRPFLSGHSLPVPAYWKEVGSNNLAGRTLIAEYDPESEQVYVASDGGQVWKGSLGGNDWICLNDQFHLTGIHFLRRIDHGSGKRLLMCSGNWNIPGFMYSDNEGQTWQASQGLENIINWGFIKRAVIKNDPGRTIYLLSLEWDYVNWNAIFQIYVSNDHGEHFSVLQTYDEPTYGNIERFDLYAAYYGDADVMMVENNHFYKITSENSIILVSEIPITQFGSVLLTGYNAGSGSVYYLMNHHDNVSEFFGSANGGTGWSLRGTVNEGPFMRNSFACSPTDPDILYFGGVNCYTSNDGGLTWEAVNWWWQYYGEPETYLHADIPGINPFVDESGNEFVIVNTDGGSYVSSDHLENVQNVSLANLRISQYYSSYTHRFNTNVSHIGSQDQGYQKSILGADTSVIDYIQLISGDYGHLVSGDGGNSLWMVYPGFAMYNTNGVGNGQLVMWDFIGSGFYWMPYLMNDPLDPKSVYLAGGSTTGGSHIYRLTYTAGQISYEEQPFDFSEGGSCQISAMACSPVDPDHRYVLTSNGGFYASADGGDTWTKSEDFGGPEAHYFYGATIAASKNAPGTVYIAGSGYSNPGAWVSFDHGQSFTAITSGLPPTLIFEIALNQEEDLLFAASEAGPFLYQVQTGSWTCLYDGTVPAQTFWSVDYIPALKTARFGTYGRGLWDFVTGERPQVNFMVNHTQICEGDPVNFIDLSLGEPVEWEWTFEGGSPGYSSERNPQGIVYNSSGSYDVKLLVHNLFGSDSVISSELIHVEALPGSPLVPQGEDTLYVNSPDTWYTILPVVGANEYQWRIIPEEAGTIAGTDTIALVNWNEGFIGVAWISAASSNNCGSSDYSDPLAVTVLFNVGMGNPDPNGILAIYPNPAIDRLFLRIEKPQKEGISYTISDISGKVVGSGRDLMSGINAIDVQDLERGVYYLVVMLEEEQVVRKFVIIN